MTQLSRSLIRFGVILNGAVIGALVLAARAGAEFESSMARVDAITSATTQQFEQLSEAARSMGQETIFTAVQAAEALREFAQAGFSVKESLAALRPVLDFAVAGNLDIAEAADIAARILRGMGQDISQLEQSLNVLTKAFTKAPITVQELGEAFKFVGPVGRAAGKDIEELTAVVTVFARAGIRGEQAGTALRNILLRLQAQPSEVKKALDKLGLSVDDGSGKMKNLATILDEVRIATSDMTQIQRQAIISQLAGVRATAAFSAAMNAGAEEIRGLEREFRIMDGTMTRISDRVLETLASKLLLTKSAFTELKLVIADQLGPVLKSTVDLTTQLIKDVTEWVSMNESLVKGIGATALILGTLTIVLGATLTLVVALGLAIAAVGTAAAAVALPLAGVVAVGLAVQLGMVAIAGGIATMMAEMTEGNKEFRKAERRMALLNQGQEELTKSSERLANIRKSLTSLEKQYNKAKEEGRVGDAQATQIAAAKLALGATAQRLKTMRDIIKKQEEQGRGTVRLQRALSETTAEYAKQVRWLKQLEADLPKVVAEQKKMLALKEAEVRAQQLLNLTTSVRETALAEENMLAGRLNDLEGKRLQILARQKTAIDAIRKAAEDSGVKAEVANKLAMDAENRVNAVTRERMTLLEQERAARVAMFTDTARQAALTALKERRDAVLQFAKGAREKAAIHLKHLQEVDALNKEFDDKEAGTEDAANLTDPGAFREGTVEAFRAAFGKNPLLDENKKQTKELVDIASSVNIIKNKPPAGGGGVAQMDITI